MRKVKSKVVSPLKIKDEVIAAQKAHITDLGAVIEHQRMLQRHLFETALTACGMKSMTESKLIPIERDEKPE